MRKANLLCMAIVLLFSPLLYTKCVNAGSNKKDTMVHNGNVSMRKIAYVTNCKEENATVSVIDLDNHNVITTIPVAKQPHSIAIVDNLAYVTHTWGRSITVVDLTRNTVIDTVSGIFDARAIALSGNHAYVKSGNTIQAIDLITRKKTDIMAVGSNPTAIAISNNFAYVTDWYGNNKSGPLSSFISVIDLTTHQVVRSIPVDRYASAIAISGNFAYVTNGSYDSNQVWVIDLTKREIVHTIHVGLQPEAIAILGNRAYVVNYRSSTVSVIDLTTRKVIRSIPVGKNPNAITISENTAYVTNLYGNTISVIDLIKNSVTDTIPAGDFPGDIVVTTVPVVPNGILATLKASLQPPELEITVAQGSITLPLSTEEVATIRRRFNIAGNHLAFAKVAAVQHSTANQDNNTVKLVISHTVKPGIFYTYCFSELDVTRFKELGVPLFTYGERSTG